MKNKIFQFKISLQEIEPLIWRRILVPATYSFWDLHVAIQDCMGWLDYHLHAFRVALGRKHFEIGIPSDDRFDDETKIHPGWQVPVADLLTEVGAACMYEYDFGDGWMHEVLLEAILLREKTQKYPRCIDGARACPPEDCGGIGGYYNTLEIISNPQNEEYEETLDWLGGKYDPEAFDPARVKFDNPQKRWNNAFGKG